MFPRWPLVSVGFSHYFSVFQTAAVHSLSLALIFIFSVIYHQFALFISSWSKTSYFVKLALFDPRGSLSSIVFQLLSPASSSELCNWQLSQVRHTSAWVSPQPVLGCLTVPLHSKLARWNHTVLSYLVLLTTAAPGHSLKQSIVYFHLEVILWGLEESQGEERTEGKSGKDLISCPCAVPLLYRRGKWENIQKTDVQLNLTLKH